MQNNTFSEGVEPGGLRDRNDIRLLLCYLLAQVDAPLTTNTILSVIQNSGMANYFEAAAALDDLQKAGNIALEADEGEELCILTGEGHLVAESLSRNLPASVRQKSVQAALALFTRMKRDRENKVVLQPLEKGFSVKCRIPDDGADLMAIELRVPDQAQAEQVRRRFMSNPAAFYTIISALLTGDEVLLSALPNEIAQLTQKENE